MPNPNANHDFLLSYEAAQKASAQVMSMSDYLKRFLDRLKELRVGQGDPLVEKADAAHTALIDLGIAIVTASKPPGKSRWE